MQRVETSVLIQATREDVLAALSPRAIVEYVGTYEVTGVEENGDATLVRGLAADQDLTVELQFEELPNGFGYEQGDAGPFEEMYTSISVGTFDGDLPEDTEALVAEPARATMRSRFTFGGRLARLKDWFAAGTRREELERALFNIADDVVEE